MKLGAGCILALTSLSDAKKQGQKNKENWVIVSGNKRSFGEHCVAEQNGDGILTMTTIKGLNEVTNCYRQLGCRDGFVLARNIASIDGLQDCWGCEDPYNTGPICHNNYEHNALKLSYRIRLISYLDNFSHIDSYFTTEVTLSNTWLHLLCLTM